MKVNIGVVGRFHGFDLAKQLKKKRVLNKLITTYPKFKIKEWGLNSNEIISELPYEILNRYKSRIPFVDDEIINSFVNKKHAKNAVAYLDECDIFIGWSASSLETIIKAKEKNKICIVERGSSHYSYQMNILKEEYDKVGLNLNLNYNNWQRELLEYELADYISIPSSFVKSSFIEYGVPESKLLVNPYGVDLSKFRQIEKKDNVFRIIYAGGLTLQKGSHYLLQAFYELDLPNCELWHIGSVKDEIIPFLKKYKHKNIVLKSHQPQDELYKLYSQGSVFIMPSIQDGFGMVILQAMACGLPIICSTNTGAYDLITKDGEEGFVIPIRDVDSIKEKIVYLYDNQDICKEMGKKAKKRVSCGFTWDDYGDRYIQNLNRIYEIKKG